MRLSIVPISLVGKLHVWSHIAGKAFGVGSTVILTKANLQDSRTPDNSIISYLMKVAKMFLFLMSDEV